MPAAKILNILNYSFYGTYSPSGFCQAYFHGTAKVRANGLTYYFSFEKSSTILVRLNITIQHNLRSLQPLVFYNINTALKKLVLNPNTLIN